MSESLLGMTYVVGPRGLKGHAKTFNCAYTKPSDHGMYFLRPSKLDQVLAFTIGWTPIFPIG